MGLFSCVLYLHSCEQPEGNGEGEPLPLCGRNRVNSISLRHSLRSQGRIYLRVRRGLCLGAGREAARIHAARDAQKCRRIPSARCALC
jgi:hypothetical protein